MEPIELIIIAFLGLVAASVVVCLVATVPNKRVRLIGFVLLAVLVVLGGLFVVGLIVYYPMMHREIPQLLYHKDVDVGRVVTRHRVMPSVGMFGGPIAGSRPGLLGNRK